MEQLSIPLSLPDISWKEIQYVNESMNAPHPGLGLRITEFEQKFRQFAQIKYAVAVINGTSGLHLCVKAAGIGPGDQVITTPFSYVASANCILYENAVPVFVDIDPLTFNIDAQKIEDYLYYQSEAGLSRIKAILPVHVFGYPCDMNHIIRVARKYKLTVIEDACEAIGAEFNFSEGAGVGETVSELSPANWRKVGSLGDMGVFAFCSNKQITTGEGAMIVTNFADIANLCRSLRNQGRAENGRWMAHEMLGYNYRLSDINCALGIAQLERAGEIMEKRAGIAEMYSQRLSNFELIRLPHAHKNVRRSWFVYVVRLIYSFNAENRDNILKQLTEKGIGCNCYFPPIHLQPFYMRRFAYKRGDFPIAESISERTIALPFYNELTETEIDYVTENLRRIVEEEFRKIKGRLKSD